MIYSDGSFGPTFVSRDVYYTSSTTVRQLMHIRSNIAAHTNTHIALHVPSCMYSHSLYVYSVFKQIPCLLRHVFEICCYVMNVHTSSTVCMHHSMSVCVWIRNWLCR